MSYANRQQMDSNRTVSIIVVALLHIVLGYALVTGLAYNVLKKVATDLKTFDVTEPPPPPEEKPPEQKLPPPPQVVAPPPMVRMITMAPQIQTVSIAPPPVITLRAPPAPPAPPAPVKRESARAKGSLIGLFSSEDYPNSALSANEQGTTAVQLTIGTDGRVSGCNITSSSGSSSLDNATCNILRRRARFSPALDSDGHPTTDTYSQRITWRVPAE
ncbi:energy transducer TonB [Sphingomonas sp.]|uniref:energy transducer TonB n=1 Tax=Sphingomonas sp. TaxID=28214 RepID=UPI0037514A2C